MTCSVCGQQIRSIHAYYIKGGEWFCSDKCGKFEEIEPGVRS